MIRFGVVQKGEIRTSPDHTKKMVKPTRQARQVLTEEEYTSTLSSIISRDYYPSLSSLRRDVAILDKRKNGDIRGAVTLRRAHREICEQEEELALRERLEEEEALENGGVRKRPR